MFVSTQGIQKCFLLLLVSFLQHAATQTTKSVRFTIDPSTILNTIPADYIGFTFDWGGDTGIWGTNLTNPDLITLTKALSPAHIRLGGSAEDSIIYNFSNACQVPNFTRTSTTSRNDLKHVSYYKSDVNHVTPSPSVPPWKCPQLQPYMGCFSIDRLKEWGNFASVTNSKLLFGLNACYGRTNYNESMDLTNIRALLTAARNASVNIYGWEFANELQGPLIYGWAFIDPIAWANDFYAIYRMVHQLWSDDSVIPIPRMVGPDISNVPYYGQHYMSSVLSTLAELKSLSDTGSGDDSDEPIMHAATYHQYVNCTYRGNNQTVFSLQCLDKIPQAAINYSRMASDIGSTQAWIGESAEHSGGGELGVTNAFASSFYFVYQLCEAITNGVTCVMRQTLIGSTYGLINMTQDGAMMPYPDYWMLWMWRQFVGEVVYESELWVGVGESGESGGRVGTEGLDEVSLRGYAFGGEEESEESVVCVFVNLDLYDSYDVHIDGVDVSECLEYHVEGSLNATSVQVNGVEMKYGSGGAFPELVGRRMVGDVVVKAASIAWVVC